MASIYGENVLDRYESILVFLGRVLAAFGADETSVLEIMPVC